MDVRLDTRSFDRDMRKLKKRTSRMKPVLKDIGIEVSELAEKRVKHSKTDPDQRHWKPWKTSTLEQRAKTGGSLMYLTGHLARSFDSKATNKKVTITNTAKYAGYLHFGTDVMKARPLLGWGRNAINTASKLLTKWFKV